MATEISVVLIGIGGYGNNYVIGLLNAPPPQNFKITGGVDPNPAKCTRLADLQARGVPIHASAEDFFTAARADLAVISSPIHLHCPQTCQALSHGCHVLCEKPLCATAEQARQMRQVRDRAGRIVAIGYQWSFSPTMQELKRDIAAGRFGRPKRLRTLALAPRDEKYYLRSRWAGAKQDERGNWVLDSPVNNATSHYLHNMLYILGPQTDRSAWPVKVKAELYRAHPIQNYDTAVLRCLTEDGAEILFVTSHATRQRRGPVLVYEFEKGTVRYDADAGRHVEATFSDGSVRNYGSPDGDTIRKLWDTMDAIHTGKPVVCGIEAASAHTACMYSAQQSREIAQFPAPLVHVEGDPGSRKTWVTDLEEALTRCYDLSRLPSELGVPWSEPGREVDTTPYRP
jgi:predicted dehydrogenase